MIQIGETAYANFRKGRLGEKSVQLLDSIPKTNIPSKLSTKKKNKRYIKRNNSFNAKY